MRCEGVLSEMWVVFSGPNSSFAEFCNWHISPHPSVYLGQSPSHDALRQQLGSLGKWQRGGWSPALRVTLQQERPDSPLVLVLAGRGAGAWVGTGWRNAGSRKREDTC